jgi:transposase InsO family protein
MAIQHIQEALDKGARQSQACEVAGISSRTLQRWRIVGVKDQRQAVEKAPVNKLSTIERKQIIDTCNREEYSSLPPKQIVPILADKGIYLASESSFYRILRDADQLYHRGRSTPPNTANKPNAYEASMPNQIWSWDITYLAREVRGLFFYLYLFMDIYSRKIIGWEVYENESAEQAAEVLRKARMAEVIPVNQKLVLHSDNGGPMKGATMLATLQKLGVVPSFSRPSVSNDNPYSESLFKTLKYTPAYPTKPFASLDEARKWVMKFVTWYNHSHRHSGLKYVTPAQRHSGEDIAILKQRGRIYAEAKKRHPERWSGETRNWNHEPIVKLNPEKESTQESGLKKAA